MFGKSGKKTEKSGQKSEESTIQKWKRLHDTNLGVTYRLKPDGIHYERSEHLMSLNEASMIALGYIPADGYVSELSKKTKKTYVKFIGFEQYPLLTYRTTEIDGQKVQELAELETKETASTLYDYFKSDAEEAFINGMQVRKSGSISTRTMVLLGIAGVVIVGGLFIAMGGR